MSKILISLFDRTGNQSRPYRENGWEVVQIDIANGQDVFDFDPAKFISDYLHEPMNYFLPDIGIIAAVPCTCYAICGNANKKKRLLNGEFAESQKLVAKTKQIIDFFKAAGLLKFWMIENPMTDIHKKNPWIGNIRQKFNPCDFAGYDPQPDNSRYNKATWIFGEFNKMTAKRLEPFTKEYPGNLKFGGKSEKTKQARSITPLGFAYAFYEANH